MTKEYEQTPEPLRKLLFLNLLEDDLSKKHFKSMMWHFLDLCGYDIVKGNRDSKNKFLSTEEELSNRIKLEKNAINSVVPYNDIKIITEEKMKDINVQIIKKQSNADDKLAVERYYFDLKINPLLNEEIKDEYFEWWMDAQKRIV
jgi:hypothetical protein